MTSIRSTRNTVGAIGLLLLAAAASAQQNRYNDPAVAGFYPQSLINEWNELYPRFPKPPLKRDFTSAEIDLNNVGTPNYIVVAYSNERSNAVVLLQKSGGSLARVAEPTIPDMSGSLSRIEAVDVDGDGKPEVIVRVLSGSSSTPVWILKWDGLTLKSICPTGELDGTPFNRLYSTGLIDIDGDGRLEAMNPPEEYRGDGSQPGDPPKEMRSEIFSLVNGQYSSASTYALSYQSFRRDTGAPTTNERQFIVSQPGPGYRLRVINGGFGSDGERRVSSGTIRLNGAVVVSPGQFSQNVSLINVPVTVQASNTLSVTLAGAPGGSIVVLVLPPN